MSALGYGVMQPATPPESLRVVMVEDDERLARLTAKYLQSHGVMVDVVGRGDIAVSEVLRVRPDLVLLDLMLPGADGTEVCRRLRERLDVPIIMVTARGEEADRVLSLEGGADDYVSKPFSSRELLARIRANVRRARGHAGPPRQRLVIGELTIDASTMTVTLAGERLILTGHEVARPRSSERATSGRARPSNATTRLATWHGPSTTWPRGFKRSCARKKS
jgi:two-component system, OmpR family, response regulator